MRFITQLGLLISGLADSFGWVYLFIAMLPFLFLWRMKNRERAWIIGLAAIYLCIGVLLTIIMNTTPDRADGVAVRGILHRLARGGCHHDRLWLGVDGGLHGHALWQFPDCRPDVGNADSFARLRDALQRRRQHVLRQRRFADLSKGALPAFEHGRDFCPDRDGRAGFHKEIKVVAGRRFS